MFKLVVLFSVLAYAAAKPNVLVPLTYGYNGLPAVSSQSQYTVHGSSYVPTVYSAGLSPVLPFGYSPYATYAQPAHSPAVLLDPINGVPLDTPEVVAARAAHYQAKALAGVHRIAKRSLSPLTYNSVLAPGVVSPLAYSTPYLSAYSTPYLSTYSTPYASAYSTPYYTSPLGYSAVVPKALSVHPY